MKVDLDDLRLSSQSVLRDNERQTCPGCSKQRSLFCYDCVKPLTKDVPSLSLPVQVDIVQHGETNAKGTGCHAAILAPNDVRIFRHSSGTTHHRRCDAASMALPQYDAATTVVLFPESEDTEVVGTEECAPFERAIVLDGTWQKARTMLKHPSLCNLRRLQLPKDVRTLFWRRGAGDFRGAKEEGVCTIETIFFLCRALHPQGHYDDLLWYFTHIRSLVSSKGAPGTRTWLTKNEQRAGSLPPLPPSNATPTSCPAADDQHSHPTHIDAAHNVENSDSGNAACRTRTADAVNPSMQHPSSASLVETAQTTFNVNSSASLQCMSENTHQSNSQMQQGGLQNAASEAGVESPRQALAVCGSGVCSDAAQEQATDAEFASREHESEEFEVFVPSASTENCKPEQQGAQHDSSTAACTIDFSPLVVLSPLPTAPMLSPFVSALENPFPIGFKPQSSSTHANPFPIGFTSRATRSGAPHTTCGQNACQPKQHRLAREPSFDCFIQAQRTQTSVDSANITAKDNYEQSSSSAAVVIASGAAEHKASGTKGSHDQAGAGGSADQCCGAQLGLQRVPTLDGWLSQEPSSGHGLPPVHPRQNSLTVRPSSAKRAHMQPASNTSDVLPDSPHESDELKQPQASTVSVPHCDIAHRETIAGAMMPPSTASHHKPLLGKPRTAPSSNGCRASSSSGAQRLSPFAAANASACQHAAQLQAAPANRGAFTTHDVSAVCCLKRKRSGEVCCSGVGKKHALTSSGSCSATVSSSAAAHELSVACSAGSSACTVMQ